MHHSAQLVPNPVPNPVPIPVPNWVFSSAQLIFKKKKQKFFSFLYFLHKINWAVEKTQLGNGMGNGLGNGLGTNWELCKLVNVVNTSPHANCTQNQTMGNQTIRWRLLWAEI